MENHHKNQKIELPERIVPGHHYTPQEAQLYLRISRQTLWRWQRAGILTPHKVGPRLNRYSGVDLLKISGGAK